MHRTACHKKELSSPKCLIEPQVRNLVLTGQPGHEGSITKWWLREMLQGTTSNFCYSHIRRVVRLKRIKWYLFPGVSLSIRDQSFKSMGFEDYQELAHKTGRICAWAVLKSHRLGGPPMPPGKRGQVRFITLPWSISPSRKFSLR